MLRVIAALATWCWIVGAGGVVGMAGGQRAPCYQCEMYRESHPHSHPYTTVRAHCVYPCNCGPIPSCGPERPVIQDGCGCCWQCARQMGEPCDGVFLCDTSRGLSCRYNTTADASGVCQEVYEAKCKVNDTIYEHGETFALDCRTQCTCQNGTYACVSLCPGENLPPSEQCHNPHLVSLPGQCCREWMCDAAPGKSVEPPSCERQSGRWSECSSKTCGVGVSVRWSTENSLCQPMNQTRLCQVRPCQKPGQEGSSFPVPKIDKYSRKHHIRRGHTCKATQRHLQTVRLRAGWCISEKRLRPKICADCPGRCCTIHASTTISVAFLCPLHANTDLLSTTRSKRSHQRLQDQDYAAQLSIVPYVDASSRIETSQLSPESVLKYPQSYEEFLDFDEALEDDISDFSKKVKKNNDNPDGNSFPNDLQNFYGSSPSQSDNLLEDAPPFESDNLTVDDDIEYNQIKNDNYETVHHQVQWILRCKCQETCEDQNALHGSPPPSGPT